MRNECPLELWFPIKVYPILQCVEAYLASQYPYCQYYCHEDNGWWKCQLANNRYFLQTNDTREKHDKHRATDLRRILDKL